MFKFRPVFCMEEGGEGGGSSDAGTVTGQGESEGAMKVSVTDGTQGDGNSASASAPLGTDAPKPAEGFDFKEAMGDLYDNKSLEGFKNGEGYDVAKLAKSYIDTKSMVGQKLGIPTEDSTDEAKAEFYKAMGVPDDAAGYEFGLPEDLPEAMKQAFSEEHAAKWAGIMKEHNVPKEVANELRNAFIDEAKEQMEQVNQGIAATDAEFIKLAEDMLGKDHEAIRQRFSEMMMKHVPEDLRADMVNSVPDTAILAAAKMVEAELAEYRGESKALDNDNAIASGDSEADLLARSRTIMASPEYSDPFAKGKEAYDSAQKEVREIHQKLAQIRKAG